ncbi:hypothetical protein niasHS_008563 [Heterodera schachtii]|uniref:NADAR domain-containing protein n=1 Tax=Heterodera schachtii TaxID=97005 RepID=A0ABD2J6T0_HETSC
MADLDEVSLGDEDTSCEEEAQKRTEVRAPMLLLGSDSKLVEQLAKQFEENEVRHQVYIPNVWDGRLFEEEIEIQSTVKAVIVWSKGKKMGLMEVLATAQRSFSEKQLFWIVETGEEQKWRSLDKWIRVTEQPAEDLVLELVMNGLEVMDRGESGPRKKKSQAARRREKKRRREDEDGNSDKSTCTSSTAVTIKKVVDEQSVVTGLTTAAVETERSVVTGPPTAMKITVEQVSSKRPINVEEGHSGWFIRAPLAVPERKSPPWPIKIEFSNRRAFAYFRAVYAFSNFHVADFTTIEDGVTYKRWCSEQYYCFFKARMFHMFELARKIREDPTMKQADMKRACEKDIHQWARAERNPMPFSQEFWNTIREKIMLKALTAKFSQNQELREMLLATENYPILEACGNTSWGIGLEMTDEERIKEGLVKGFRGRNLGGQLLMEVRQNIRGRTKAINVLEALGIELQERWCKANDELASMAIEEGEETHELPVTVYVEKKSMKKKNPVLNFSFPEQTTSVCPGVSEVINSECKKSGGKADRERTTNSGRQRTSGRDNGRQQAIGREKTEEANSGTKANNGRQRAIGTGDAAAGGQEMEKDTKRNDERKEDEENAERVRHPNSHRQLLRRQNGTFCSEPAGTSSDGPQLRGQSTAGRN